MKKKQSVIRYKNPAGQWRFKVSFQLSNYRVRKQNFITKKEAEIYKDKVRLLILTDSYDDYLDSIKKESSSALSVQDYYDRVQRCKIRSIRKTTKHRYFLAIKSHVLPVVGKKSLSDITQSDYQRIFNIVVESGCSAQSAKMVLACFSWLMRRASTDGLIEIAPKPSVRVSRKSRMIYLTDKELNSLVVALNSSEMEGKLWLKIAILLQLECFLRVGELIGLEWRDIDFKSKSISILRQVNHLKEIGETKNSRIHTSFPVSDELLNLLKMYRLRVGNLKFLFPALGYFATTDRSKNRLNKNIGRLSRATYHENLKKIAEMAGISKGRLSSHILRKTGCDRLIRNGFSVHQAAFALRINPQTILRNYSTIDEKHFMMKIRTFEVSKSADKTPTRDFKEIK